MVTGASGFLGRPLTEKLAETGAQVHALSRTVPQLPTPSVRWWQADLTAADNLERLLQQIQPEFVYHLASASSGAQSLDLLLPTFEGDLRTTVNVLAASKRCGSPTVFLVGSLEEPLSNGQPAFPASPYAAAKTAAAMYARMFHHLYDLPVVTLRVFMAYGPGQKPFKVIPHTILSLLDGKSPELGPGTRELDWVYVEDVIEAFVAAATSPNIAGSTIELGSGQLTSVRDVAEEIRSLIPGAPPLKIGARTDRKLELVRPAADPQSAALTLGWTASTSLKTGLAKTIEWYRTQFTSADHTSCRV